MFSLTIDAEVSSQELSIPNIIKIIYYYSIIWSELDFLSSVESELLSFSILSSKLLSVSSLFSIGTSSFEVASTTSSLTDSSEGASSFEVGFYNNS